MDQHLSSDFEVNLRAAAVMAWRPDVTHLLETSAGAFFDLVQTSSGQFSICSISRRTLML